MAKDLFPVTHKFVVNRGLNMANKLFPITHSFVVVEQAPPIPESDIYEGINICPVSKAELEVSSGVDFGPTNTAGTLSVELTYAVVGMYVNGPPPDSGGRPIDGDCVRVVFPSYGATNIPALYPPTEEGKWWYHYGPYFYDGFLITKSEMPSYDGWGGYGDRYNVANIQMLPTEKKVYTAKFSMSWEKYTFVETSGGMYYINILDGDHLNANVDPRLYNYFLAHSPMDMLTSLAWVNYPPNIFANATWSASSTYMFPRPTSGPYPVGMTDVIWWIYDFQYIFNGKLVCKLKAPTISSNQDPFALNQGVISRKFISKDWAAAPWKRYPAL